ncbi:glycosyltransferase family 2 protein [Rathayibacter sp. CAU 1779]
MTVHGGTHTDRIVVVVPAHNEEATLAGCLDSILVATRRIDVESADVLLVLDDCSDGSAAVSAGYPAVSTVVINSSCVGAARSTGVARAFEGRTDEELRRTWLATTDADSVVPPNWLRVHLAAARAGADVLIGAVVPVLEDLDEHRARIWRARHQPGATLGHVHGANLGVRASTYQSAGGFPSTTEDEDIDLVQTLRGTDAIIVETEQEPVVTSARLRGRVPNGYAAYLAALD